MTLPHHMRRAKELISRIDRHFCLKDWHRGYTLRKPGSQAFGYVRFNVRGERAGKYMVYAYSPFDDPRNMFKNETVATSHHSWRCVVRPDDENTIRHVISVLESSYDQK